MKLAERFPVPVQARTARRPAAGTGSSNHTLKQVEDWRRMQSQTAADRRTDLPRMGRR
jgi:hypothetical protein